MTKPIICVDFDGVIASWDQGTFWQPGPPIPGAEEFLKQLATIGEVIIWTCRTNSKMYDGTHVAVLRDRIWWYLIQWGLTKHVDSVYVGDGKPYATCYIDDKAIYCDPERIGKGAFTLALGAVEALCHSNKAHCQKGTEPCTTPASDSNS